MEYIVNGKKYSLSYQELREWYYKIKEMEDVEFMQNLPKILHLACIICFLKEIPTHACLCDEGIVHELVHLLDGSETSSYDLKSTRELFNEICELS